MDRVYDFFNKSLNIILKSAAVLFLLVGLLYLGACVAGNFFQHKDQPADIPEATYEVFIMATRQFLYSNDVKQNGSIIKLDGYYELKNNKYVYHKESLFLDETTTGEIIVGRK